MEKKSSNAYAVLSKIDCSDYIEKKNGLTYLSWSWAWAKLKENFPDATCKVYEDQRGLPYFTDGRTAWVKVGVTIDGQEAIEWLPVMDARNRSIIIDNVTSFDVNKAVQRCATKAIARHGLGLYIYAGEDLPEDVAVAKKEEAEQDLVEKINTACFEMRSVKSRDELVETWSKWKAIVPSAEGTEFHNEMVEACKKYPRPQATNVTPSPTINTPKA